MYTLHKHPEKGVLSRWHDLVELIATAPMMGLDTFYILNQDGIIVHSQRPGFDLPIFLRNQGE